MSDRVSWHVPKIKTSMTIISRYAIMQAGDKL